MPISCPHFCWIFHRRSDVSQSVIQLMDGTCLETAEPELFRNREVETEERRISRDGSRNGISKEKEGKYYEPYDMWGVYGERIGMKLL